MRLPPHAHKKLWDVHTWAGIIAGLILFVMFLTGAVTLFHGEIEAWEHPKAHAPATQVSLQRSFDAAVADFEKVPQTVWFSPPAAEYGQPKIGYANAKTGKWEEKFVDPQTGQTQIKREWLALLMYYVHVLWHDSVPWMYYYVASALGVAMVLALFTGLLIHLRNVVRQFHQFRPEKKPRTFWIDMHKVLGVLGFPFQFLYAFSGAFLILAPFLLQAFSGPVFDDNQTRADIAYDGMAHVHDIEPGEPAEVVSLDKLTRKVKQIEPGFKTEFIRVLHYGHENSLVDFTGELEGGVLGTVKMRFRATDGELLTSQLPETEGAAVTLRRWLLGLHVGTYGGLALRILLFVLALGTCATIVSGSRIWLARRRRKKDTLGYKMLARLTVGVGAGSFVAVAASFLASRVLPMDMQGRIAAEELTFILTLAGCIVWAFWARDEDSIWWKQFGLAGLLLLPVPLIATRWTSAGLFGGGTAVAPVIGMDIGILLMGASLCALAAWLWHWAGENDQARRSAPGGVYEG